MGTILKATRAGVHYDREIGRLFLSIVDRDKTWSRVFGSHFHEVANYLLQRLLAVEIPLRYRPPNI